MTFSLTEEQTAIVEAAKHTKDNLAVIARAGAAMGDLPHGSIGYQSIFAAGLALIVMTLGFNILGHMVRKKFRETY